MANKKNSLKNVEIQENSNMCAFIYASMDYTLYHINCLHCDASFLLLEWSNFIQHMQDEHCYDEESTIEHTIETSDDNVKIGFQAEKQFATENQEQIIIKNEDEQLSYTESFDGSTIETSDNYDIALYNDTNCSQQAGGDIHTLNDFRIPWHKMPPKIKKCFEKREPLGVLLKKFSHILVAEMRYISTYIPKNICRLVAAEAIAKYPDSFVEVDFDGKVISEGNLSLATKLLSRNSFLNKKEKTKSIDTSLFGQTCTNWQPMQNNPVNQKRIQEMESKKQTLILLYKQNDYNAQKQMILKNMKESFALQRIFVNKIFWKESAINDILLEWPFLLRNEACLKQHFNQLMSIDSDCFVVNYLNTKSKIIAYIQNLKSSKYKNFTNDEEIFKGIVTYFNENVTSLYQKYECETTVEHVSASLKVKTPFMAIIPENNNQQFKIHFFIDKICVMSIQQQESLNFFYLLSLLIQMFYVLNILYPKEMSQSLEFCVKFFYKYYCDVPRSTKKSIDKINKINGLCKRISTIAAEICEPHETRPSALPGPVENRNVILADDRIIVKDEATIEEHLNLMCSNDSVHSNSNRNENDCSSNDTEILETTLPTPRHTELFTKTKTTAKFISSTHLSDKLNAAISNRQALFDTYRIPWQKLEPTILECCEQRKPLGRLLTSFANRIINELRLISKHIPLSVFRSIAEQATHKYPETFVDRDHEGNVTSGIDLTLLTKLRNRNSFLNRKGSQNQKTTTKNNLKSIPLICINRRIDILRKSCSNWQPTDTNYIDEKILENMKHNKNQLVQLYKQHKFDETHREMFMSHMKETYPLQRLNINSTYGSNTATQHILNEWPFLFKEACLNQHFDQLMSIDSNCIEANYSASKNLILAYLRNRKNSVYKFKNFTSDEEVFNAIANYFGEDLTFLYKKFKYDTSLDIIMENLAIETPFMAILSNDNDKFEIAYIFVDKLKVMTLKSNDFTFTYLLSLLVKLHYVLNIFYPKEISLTLDFFVKFFCKYYCEISRGNKTSQKVNGLIKRISKFKNNMETEQNTTNSTKHQGTSEVLTTDPCSSNFFVEDNDFEEQESTENYSTITVQNTNQDDNKIDNETSKDSLLGLLSIDEIKIESEQSVMPQNTITLTNIATSNEKAYPSTFLEHDSNGNSTKQQKNAKLRNRNSFLNLRTSHTSDSDTPTNAKRAKFSDIEEYLTDFKISATPTMNKNTSNEFLDNETSTCLDYQNTKMSMPTIRGFQIPWDRLSPHILDRCFKKQKLNRCMTNEFVVFIIDELRFISKNISSFFRSVVQQANEKYPATFLEYDNEGYIISIQNSSLIKKLRNRNYFLNRNK